MKKLKWHNETRKVSDLVPYERNPRRITESQRKHLQESLEKFGLVEVPAINTDNKIIAGHQRIKILALLGRQDEEIDVRVPNRTLTPAEFEEYCIRSNKNKGEWDTELLSKLDEELLLSIGFEPKELDDIFDLEKGKKDPDEVPEAPVKPKSSLGDIYMLGDHMLMCGDSTKKDDIRKLIGKNVIDMVFTDPPYNVNYSGKGKNTSNGIKNDSLDPELFKEFISKVFNNMREIMKEGAVYYICSGWSSYPVFYENLIKEGFYRAGVIIWVKDNAGLGWNDFRYKHEWILVGKKRSKKVPGIPILYGWKDGPHYFRDTRDECDVWEVPRKNLGDYKHPTEKPVWLVEKALANSSERYQNVLDLFGGSGSTLIACERLKRKCFIIEYDARYVDVIIQRWEEYTGRKAEKVQ